MEKKIISKLHAVDRIFSFIYVKFLSIFAFFEDSDKLADIYIYIYILLFVYFTFANINYSLAPHPSGSLVATGQIGVDPKICLWDTNSMSTIAIIHKCHTRGMRSLNLFFQHFISSFTRLGWRWRNIHPILGKFSS
jgi:hypothetical protein